jgi:HPt (histidine-containing phosphotransfer) domain-containing protein
VDELMAALNKSQHSAGQESSPTDDSLPQNRPGIRWISQEPASTTLDPHALSQLLKLVGGDKNKYFELIDSFLEEEPKLLQSLLKAIENKDKELLSRASHSLKSSSRDFGASQLSKLCEKLESISKTNSLAGVWELIEQVEMEYASVDHALNLRAVLIV